MSVASCVRIFLIGSPVLARVGSGRTCFSEVLSRMPFQAFVLGCESSSLVCQAHRIPNEPKHHPSKPTVSGFLVWV